MESTLFMIFSGRTRGSARSVVLVSHPVHAVLCLIASFVSACALMLLLQVEFMALIFVVVYVGAIAVLFLFVVMMLNLNVTSMPGSSRDFRRRDLWASFVLLTLVMLRRRRTLQGASQDSARDLAAWVNSRTREQGNSSLNGEVYRSWIERMDSVTTMETRGQVLYTHSFVYLLMAGFVLLVARIGAIVLTLKVRTFARAKRQQVYQQRSRDAESAIMRTRAV